MILALGNYGTKLILAGQHPRKELLSKLGATHAERTFFDKPDGSVIHVGYVVRREWFELFTCVPIEKEVSRAE